ncbi:unnamed protein product [Calypogeia fissa]
MLSQAGLPKVFWAKVVNTTTYLLTLSPVSNLQFKTPFEMWYGKPADYTNLQMFDCEAYVLYTPVGKTKLDPRSRKCIFLGYQKGVKGYQLWDPKMEKLVVNIDVSFNELPSLKEGEKEHVERVEGEIEHEFAPELVVHQRL